jgi:predicted secreted protein
MTTLSAPSLASAPRWLRLGGFAFLVPVALVGALAAGCSDDSSPSTGDGSAVTGDEDELKSLVIKESDDGKSFSVAQGKNVVVSLPSNPSTGFDWQVVQVDKSLGYPAKTFVGGGKNAPVGAGGTTKLTWKTSSALTIGTHEVKLAYQRESATADSLPEKTFSFTIIVVGKGDTGKACVRTGCSGQLCVEESPDGMASTCEYRPVYACYQAATCARQDDGKCGFTPTEELASCVAEASKAGEGEGCGGIAGIQCHDGLSCQLQGDYPDAGGTCVADGSGPKKGGLGDFCGGIAAFQCQDGLTCQLEGDYPDAGGTCVEDTSGPKKGGLGDFCGGIAGFQCQDGLTCQLEGDYPDAGGTCVEDTSGPKKGGVGDACGGIAGLQCQDGLSCQLEGDYPDAGGTCIQPKKLGFAWLARSHRDLDGGGRDGFGPLSRRCCFVTD